MCRLFKDLGPLQANLSVVVLALFLMACASGIKTLFMEFKSQILLLPVHNLNLNNAHVTRELKHCSLS